MRYLMFLLLMIPVSVWGEIPKVGKTLWKGKADSGESISLQATDKPRWYFWNLVGGSKRVLVLMADGCKKGMLSIEGPGKVMSDPTTIGPNDNGDIVLGDTEPVDSNVLTLYQATAAHCLKRNSKGK